MGEMRKGIVDRFYDIYPKLIEAILGGGQVVITLIQVSIQSMGIVIILGMLAVVEVVGIESGLWFLEDYRTAHLAAIAFVAYNMVVDTMIVNIEHKHKYKSPQDTVSSLRLWYRGFKYRIGYGDDWKARQKSPAQSFYTQRKLITFTIFFIALSGRLQPLIVSLDDVSWSEGIHRLVVDATLQDLFTWVSGVTVTMASLFGVQRLTHYMAEQVIIIRIEQKQNLKNKRSRETRRQTRQRRDAMMTRLTTDARQPDDRRDTDATRGAQRLSQGDALKVLRDNIDVIQDGKSASQICDDLGIDPVALRTVQRALKVMRDNSEIR